MQQIDHNPNEKRPTNSIWWILAALLAFGWIGIGMSDGYVWPQIALGAFSGMVLATWAIEKTGNKVPDWMK